MRAMILILTLLAVSACVPDAATYQLKSGKWASYHDLSKSIGEQMVEKQSAPQDVKDRFAECLADYVTKAYTPAELERLDAYARGEAVTNGELKQLDAAGKGRMNGTKMTNDTLDRLDTTCPQDIPDFRKHLDFG